MRQAAQALQPAITSHFKGRSDSLPHNYVTDMVLKRRGRWGGGPEKNL